MHLMSRDEWWAFASDGTRTGKIAVTRKDGQALVTPIWFLLDAVEEDGQTHDEFVFTTHNEGAKARILARDPRVCLLVDDQQPPYSYVQLIGRATLHVSPDDLLSWTTRLGARYMGADRAEEFGRRNAVPEEFLVRVRIDKVNAVADISD
ncbi:PPOX class probable F420-dependent enzyme [Friedmanniella endophytica]|uniref:PPOX class probable F420-dependent enzyme n=1 Tax=Microlunatus kandeliicorticis TaxID=1759536 RepID=A0A7W3INR7_9ACTN|nr:PPOX class F420-dependent oxidoreductase [Microlunatus kandeliicorticis]MBA8792460.1 PPOX class probable F420-dependent enzyme [Microlunatus kandeliicorticis]